MLRRGVERATLFVLVLLPVVLGNWNDTSTGIDLGKLPHFPVFKVRAGWLKDNKSVKFDAITATAGSAGVREVRLRGSGKSGKRWEAPLAGLDEVWRADLDGNGTHGEAITAIL